MRAFLDRLMNEKLMRQRRGAMGGRKAYCHRMEGLLRDWETLFSELRADAAGGTTRVRANYVGSVDAFARRRSEAEGQLAVLEAAPPAQWIDHKPAVDRTFDELRRFVVDAKLG
jgi:hypothetical protein